MKNLVPSTFVAIISGFILFFLYQYHQPGVVGADSVSYLEVADNILKGNGVHKYDGQFVNHWPPLYPATIALLSFFIKTSLLGSVSILFIAISILIFLLFDKISVELNLNSRVRFLSLIFLLISNFYAQTFLTAGSEALFDLLLLLSFYFLIRYTKRNSSIDIVLCGLFTGLMIITRYAGIAFIPAIILIIFITSKQKGFFQKIVPIVLHLIGVFTFYGLWMSYAHRSGAASTSRVLVWHPFSLHNLLQMGNTFFKWVTPEKSIIFMPLVIVSVLVWLFSNKLTIIKNFRTIFKEAFAFDNAISICLAFVASYILFVLISLSLFDAHTPLNNRVLSPMFPFLVILFASVLQKVIKLRAQFAIILFCSAIFISNILKSYKEVRDFYKKGLGYNNDYWSSLNINDFIPQDLDEKGVIYTNEPAFFRFALKDKRTVLSFPHLFEQHTKQKNENLENDWQKMKIDIQSKKAVCIINPLVNKDYLINSKEIFTRIENVRKEQKHRFYIIIGK